MKSVLFLSLLLCAFARAAPAQRISSQPFKGANAILLSVRSEAPDKSVYRLAAVCRRLGFTVDSMRPDRFFTTPRPVAPPPNGTAAPALCCLTAFIVKIGAGPTVIMLWGALRFSDASGRLVERTVRWDGPRLQSPAADCFSQAQRLAQAFPAEQLVSIRYTKEKRL